MRNIRGTVPTLGWPSIDAAESRRCARTAPRRAPQSRTPRLTAALAASLPAMSGFEFGSRLTDSLAWPVFALLIVLVLRRPLAELLARRPLSRMKAGPFEV